ncbi:type II secretion system protein GspL [Sphingomicrobium aestuariivivum]|uniref:type II secretion system protein GspL n=1 Tax=Sphingomicrobium aestuariivivum TaxID=1582356 RepID=UPI001FD69F69|nr:type II secretion system protein GspL [Sphingomicrobium aestuariivivum]MCJ8191265.1 type II secretion system protein GspL [Sphingomicrobium aestuariivivum]
MVGRTLLLWLPTRADAPAACPWWEVAEGRLVAHGSDSGWLPRSAEGSSEPVTTIGLVGPAEVRLEPRAADAPTSPQAKTAARLGAEGKALGTDPHAAVSDAWIATTDGARMQDWLDWAAAQDIALDRIVPAAALLPRDGDWHEARFGPHVVIAKDGMAIPDDEALVAALVGDAFVDSMDNDAIVDALVALEDGVPVDLRQGRFARVRRWKPDPRRLREFAWLILAIFLVALAIPVTKAVLWEREAGSLDRETAAIATAALGRPVEAAAAEAELRAAIGQGGAATGATQAIATLLAAMQAEPTVEASMIFFGADGMLNARLAASDAGAINRILMTLQQRGWTVTANPVPGGDGRAAVDLSLLGGA